MRSEERLGISFRTLKAVSWLSASFVAVFMISVWGFLQIGHSMASSVYFSLQLIVLDGPAHLHDQWSVPLIVAAFLLPMYAIVAFLGLLLSVVSLQWNVLRTHISPRSRVFLGGGQLSLSLLQAYADNSSKDKNAPIVVTRESLNRRTFALKKGQRPLWFRQDFTDLDVLKRLRLESANIIYVISNNESENLDVARKIILLVEKHKKRKQPRLVIRINQSATHSIAAEEPAFLEYQSHGGITWLHFDDLAARQLLKRFPPPIKPLQYAQPLHIGIVGQSGLSESLILQLVKQYFPIAQSELRLTFFGEYPERFSQFLSDHPVLNAHTGTAGFAGIAPIVTLKFVEIGTNGLTPDLLLNTIRNDSVCPQLFYVTTQEDLQSLAFTLTTKQAILANDFEAQVITCLQGDHIADGRDALLLLPSNKEKSGTDFSCFHSIKDVFNANEKYPGEATDVLGVYVHAAYRSLGQEYQGKNLEETVYLAKAEWKNDLPEKFRASSRASGDHILVKLRYMGFDLTTKKQRHEQDDTNSHSLFLQELESKIDEQLSDLLKIEHYRYCAERFIDGWYSHSSNRKDLKLNATLVSFDKLPKSEIHKDEVIIRMIPQILSQPDLQKRYQLLKKNSLLSDNHGDGLAGG
ncbi:hypothetical protein [Aliidiomarina indica]|uniref:hypothetical protein n=1 Tax=Aliidiomarina indica TaxID=2749147 RepID=UPI0018907821|nr:hypothetical protein [Aliidiomarina indica]